MMEDFGMKGFEGTAGIGGASVDLRAVLFFLLHGYCSTSEGFYFMLFYLFIFIYVIILI